MQSGLSPTPPAVLQELVDAPVRDDGASSPISTKGTDTAAADPPLRGLPVARKVAGTTLTLAILLAVPYAHPSMSRLRLLTPKQASVPVSPAETTPLESTVGEVALPGETHDDQGRAKELEAAPVDARSPIARGPDAAGETQAASRGPAALTSIEDPSGKALSKFFDKLGAVEQKKPGAIARVVYYGDSIVGSDFVTGKLRRMLQSRFGDAGHGYALLANAWPGWFHIDVSRTASANWKASRVIGPYAEDGLYGLGGVSFHAEEPDAWARFATADSPVSTDVWGRAVSRFEIEYLAQPGGGDLALVVDGEHKGTLSTAADEKKLAWHTVTVADGPHSLEVRTVDARPVRAFGIRMERDVPGVTLSAMGITGSRARFLDKNDDAHWAQALVAAKPDLVVLAYGTNEIADGMRYPMADYEATLRAVMKQVRAALPDASLMLAGPPDMATTAEGTMHTRPTVQVIVGIQRKVAAEEGWAFWDQYKAMGGAGSMWAWVKAGLGNTDLFHPTGSGGNQLGTWEYRALMEAYDARGN